MAMEKTLADFLNIPEFDQVSSSFPYKQYEDIENETTTEADDYKPSSSLLYPTELELFNPVPLTLGPPERNNFAGDLKFSAYVNAKHTHRTKYVYSHKLNRIFVNMGHPFSLQFKWASHLFPRNEISDTIFIRSTLVFSDQHQWQQRVRRCLQHKDIRDEDILLRNHVLLSDRPNGACGVHYTGGDETQMDSWASVLVEFSSRHEDPNGFSHAYKFVCKNSCSSGINRRATEIMFTLEDYHGKVYGRDSIGVRICSCPRRDMGKDEEGIDEKGIREPTKRRRPALTNVQNSPPTKKVAIVKRSNNEPQETSAIITLPAGLKIVGKKTVQCGFGAMINMMEGLASKCEPGLVEEYNTSIEDIKKFLDQMNQSQ